jgi:hypothetical protein
MKLPPELVAALDVDDLAGCQVVADWLIARGDPWGDLINAQCRLEDSTDPAAFLAFKRQADTLIATNRLTWLGAAVVAHWRRGFVERLEVEAPTLLPSALGSPVGGLTRQLALSGGPLSLRAMLDTVLAMPPARLETLSLTGKGTLSGPLPSPCGLEVHGLTLDWVHEPGALRRLSVADAPAPALEPWLAGVPSTLERLELLMVDLPHPALQALVDRQGRLRVLHLEDDLPDDLARWLAGSPVLKHLDHLALGGPLTDDGLDAVLTHFARFSRLKSVVLYGGVFGPTAKKWAFKQLPRLLFGKQRPGLEWPGHPRHGIRTSPPTRP